MIRRIGLVLGAAALCVGAASAQYSIAAPHRGVGVQVWFEDLEGEVGGRDPGFSGSADIQADGAAVAGLTGNLGRLELGFMTMDHDTQAPVRSTFRFDGQTYNAGDTLVLDQRVTMFDIFKRRTFASSDASTVHALYGLKVLGFESKVRGTVNPTTADLDETVPLPMIGMAARVGPKDSIHGFAGFRLMSLGIGDVDAKILDWSIGAAYQPTPRIRAAVGYRSFTLDVDVEDGARSGRLDIDHTGPFVEVGIQF